MKRPILGRLTPETSGFNKQRIALAGTVLLCTLGVLTYLLTRTSGESIVLTEPRATPSANRPPRELLEELPDVSKPPPPVLQPDFFRRDERPPAPLPVEPRISPRVIKAFQGISYSRRQPPPSAAPVRPSALPPELTSIFKDLEQQNQALGEFLEQPPSSLSQPDLSQLEARFAQPPLAGARSTPPETRHQRLHLDVSSGAFVLRQGTVIPAQLLTEINSDLPGQVLAHISSDVRDSLSFRRVLLPRGTKLVGSYSSGLGTGQNRLAVAWTRLLLPGGGSIDLDELPAVDAQGRSGLRDRVNHHTGRLFGNALMLSLIGAGFQVAQPGSGQLRLSAAELAIDGASQELERAAAEILRQSGSIPPTVRIRAGTAFNVFLTGDLTLPASYRS